MSLPHSLHPFFFDYDVQRWPQRLVDQNFGIPVTPDELIVAATSPVIPSFKTWWPKDRRGSMIVTEKDKWSINIDVQHFAPDEISVKISNGFIIIEGKHEEKQDEHGYVSRQFVRRFKLPEDSNPDIVESRLSSDGVLTVIAPRKSDLPQGERTVPISHTGPVRKEAVEDPVKPDVVREETKEEMKEEAKELVQEEAKKQVKEEAKEQVKEEAKKQVKEDAQEQVKGEAKKQVKEEAQEQVKGEAKKQKKEEAQEQVKEKAKEPVKEEVKEQVKEEVKEQVKEKAKEPVKEEVKGQAKQVKEEK